MLKPAKFFGMATPNGPRSWIGTRLLEWWSDCRSKQISPSNIWPFRFGIDWWQRRRRPGAHDEPRDALSGQLSPRPFHFGVIRRADRPSEQATRSAGTGQSREGFAWRGPRSSADRKGLR